MSKPRAAALFGVALALSLLASAPADARRGGSFGSRGSRTYSAPAPTAISPGYAGPVQRSMTPRTSPYSPGYAPSYAPSYNPGYAARPRFGGFGGGFLGGLVTGGLVGAMMGHGFGWGGGGGWGGGMGMGGGLLAAIIQLAVLGLLISFAVRLFRGPRLAPAGPFAEGPSYYDPPPQGSPWGPQPVGGYVPQTDPGAGPAIQIPITGADREAFERLLMEVQDAFAREDYGALRARTTPEVMGYLAEELSDNATHGRRNQVSGTRLLQTEVSEAWREGDADYATVALRYESIDVMVDRNTGQVLEGDPNRPTQTTELWTFVRRMGEGWKLSAIQETH